MVFISLLSAGKIAVVTKTYGDVFLLKITDKEFSKGIPVGTILEENDKIKTENGYLILVLLDDKTQIKLRPNTELSLKGDPDSKLYQYRMNLDFGTVFTSYEKAGNGSFRIATPTSVASVKGTEFWVESKPLGVDRICVITGAVDVLNNSTGEIATANSGETVKCSNSGELLLVPSAETPLDPEEEFGANEPIDENKQIKEELEELVENNISDEPDEILTKESQTLLETEPIITEQSTPVFELEELTEANIQPITEEDALTQEQPETSEQPKEEKSEPLFGENLDMKAGFGAVTIDGDLYNQIALRPDISFGKLGIGLDIVLYLDQDGNLRDEDWNEFSDIFDKIMYVRWGQQGDPFFVRAGTIEKATLGYGLIMNNYSNSIEYPDVKKLGLHTGFTSNEVGVELMISDLKWHSGLIGLRGTYNIGQLKFGTSWISDFNPYLGLTDKDGDGYPDIVDDFPNIDEWYNDTDGDGIPDEHFDEDVVIPESGWDIDADGDNILDADEDDVDILLNPIPFNVNKNRHSLNSLSFDIGYPIFSNDWVNLTAYSEVGTYFGEKYDFYNIDKQLDNLSYGWGMVMPGLKAKFLKLFDINIEYRRSAGHFVYGLFNHNYDVERVSFIDLTEETDTIGLHPITKYEQLYRDTKMSGVFGSISSNIFNIASLSFGYQDMRSSDSETVKGIEGNLSIYPSFIPKLKSASAYINRMNVDDPWEIKSEGTLIGYNVSVDIGGGTIMSWIFQQSYRDINGDGKISGEDETITSTSIETTIEF